MNTMYLDIMEKALSAYTSEGIATYIDEVKRGGLTEHGFPRLGANIGILIAHGRRMEMLDTFVEIMDICCEEMPRKKAHNDFSIREVCCCLMLLEQKEIVSKELIRKWKEKLCVFDPWKFYSVVDDHSGKFVGNWAMFAAVSEYVRGKYCGIDATAFVDWQIPSQLANLDENDMYQDHPPYANHTVYDLVPRFLFAFLLRAGYKGKYAKRLEKVLDHTVEFTLKMQSVTGELAFGGRSNQFIHNDTMLCAYFEMEAARLAEKGERKRAEECKAAALLAANAAMRYLKLSPINHVKNRYDRATKIGCEKYAYFNKYMITAASNLYPAILFGNDTLTPSLAPAIKGGYVIRTSDVFHKTFLTAGGYHIELDTDADFEYDAGGLGRVHKVGCPSPLCLSVPFPRHPHYILENENPTNMSLCCYAETDGKKLLGAERYARYSFVGSESSEREAQATFSVKLTNEIAVLQKYCVSEKGVEITLSGYETVGFMVPVFDFDGEVSTDISLSENCICVSYQNALCKYHFDGKVSPEFRYYYNRNGRYRVYQVEASSLTVTMEENCREL